MDVGPSDDDGKRSPSGFNKDAFLRAPFAPVSWVAPDLVPPDLALPMLASTDCHSQSTPSNSSHSRTRTDQIRANTPRSHQCWKWRCKVLSSPNSRGRWFHWHPDRKRKITPLSTRRKSTRRKSLGFLGYTSSSTSSISAHPSSDTSQIVGISHFRLVRILLAPSHLPVRGGSISPRCGLR